MKQSESTAAPWSCMGRVGSAGAAQPGRVRARLKLHKRAVLRCLNPGFLEVVIGVLYIKLPCSAIRMTSFFTYNAFFFREALWQ